MISAQNHQPLLNGSSLIWLFMLSMFLGCASSSLGTSSTRVITPDKKEEIEEVEVISVDTIQWTFSSPVDDPPISMESRVEAYSLDRTKKEQYNVAVMLPLRLGTTIPELDGNNMKFAEFYAGLQLAAKQVDDVFINVKTYYTNRDVGTLQGILNDFDFFRPDVIIGSYESEIIKQTAEWAKKNRVAIISPWLSSTKIAEENVFYLQMRPSITKYYEKLVEYINYNHDQDKVYIVGREEKDDTKIRVLRDMNEKKSSVPVVTTYQEMMLSEEDLMEGDSLFYEVLEEGAQAFILPHYSTRDESYLYSTLRKLYAEQGEYDFQIYTMPLLLNSDRIDVSLLKNLNTRTVEFRFPDPRNPEVKNFKHDYYNSYGWLPTEDSYYGYDIMKFVEYGLSNYGQYFHYYMKDEPLELMQMKVSIAPYFKSDEEQERPEFMTNEHLYIIEYNRDHFTVTDIR